MRCFNWAMDTNFQARGQDMLNRLLFDKGNAPALLRSLDASMMRSRTIANNIANVNTPGYRRVEVSFEDELRQALDKTRLKGTRTNGKHFDIGRKDLTNVQPVHTVPTTPRCQAGSTMLILTWKWQSCRNTADV